MDLCAPRTEAGCCQFISVTTDSRRVISYGLMVSGDVFYAAGWAEANSETVADASEEVTSEHRVGVAEQILVPGILRKEPVHPAGAAVTVVLRIYVFQGQEVHILVVAPIHNPSNLDLCETRGGKVTRLPRLGGVIIQFMFITRLRAITSIQYSCLRAVPSFIIPSTC